MKKEKWVIGVERENHSEEYQNISNISPLCDDVTMTNMSIESKGRNPVTFSLQMLPNNIVWDTTIRAGIEVLNDPDINNKRVSELHLFSNSDGNYYGLDRQNLLLPVYKKKLSNKIFEALKIKPENKGVFIIKTISSGTPGTIYNSKQSKYIPNCYNYTLSEENIYNHCKDDYNKLPSNVKQDLNPLNNTGPNLRSITVPNKKPSEFPIENKNMFILSDKDKICYMNNNKIRYVPWNNVINYYTKYGPDIKDEDERDGLKKFVAERMTTFDNVIPSMVDNQYYRNELSIQYIKFIPEADLFRNGAYYDDETDLLLVDYNFSNIDAVNSIKHPYSRSYIRTRDAYGKLNTDGLNMNIKISGSGIWYMSQFGMPIPIVGVPPKTGSECGFTIKFGNKIISGSLEELPKYGIYSTKEQAETMDYKVDKFEVEKIEKRKELEDKIIENKEKSLELDIEQKLQNNRLDIAHKEAIQESEREQIKFRQEMSNNTTIFDYYMHINKSKFDTEMQAAKQASNLEYERSKHELNMEMLESKAKLARIGNVANVLSGVNGGIKAALTLKDTLTSAYVEEF